MKKSSDISKISNQSKIPKLKKKFKDFLLNEDGKISKKLMIKGGVLFSSIVTTGFVSAAYSNLFLDHTQAGNSVTAHHLNGHSNHANHSSY